MSSPGSSRRLTRSSVRRCLAGDVDEPADRGLEQTSAGISAHQRDGLSSDPGSESDVDTVPVHELDSTYADATDDSAAEEYDRVTSVRVTQLRHDTKTCSLWLYNVVWQPNCT